MLKYEKLTKENLQIGLEIQAKIFPHECDNDLLTKSVEENGELIQDLMTYSAFWLVKLRGNYIGITGLYAYEKYPHDVWMNWFGVVREFRRHGLGRKILKWTIKKAKSLKYKYFRLYTEIGDNDDAIAFYRHQGFKEEFYLAEKEIDNFLIFSKALHLHKRKVKKWNNRPLYLYEQLLNYSVTPFDIIKETPRSFLYILFCRPRTFWRILRKTIHSL